MLIKTPTIIKKWWEFFCKKLHLKDKKVSMEKEKKIFAKIRLEIF
ncbi:MAG: hypothetical protein PWQ37_2009 [Candidatus Petromonas sp.]|nr:hypothetical protein [Candidatus Petromonas sp.]